MKYFNILLILFVISCGKTKPDSNSSNDNIYVSYEKNEFICTSCLILNIEPNILQITFDQTNEVNECEGFYNYRPINTNEKIVVPSNSGETLEVQLEYIDDKELSNCLNTILNFSVKNIGNNSIEVYMNNYVYLLKN